MTIAANTTESLNTLRLPELRALFTEVTGETTKSPNKSFLIRRIREALAAQAAEVVAEEQAIEEMTATATAEPEPTTEPEPASAPMLAEETATTETTTMIAPESEAATSTPTSANSAEPEPATTETTEDEDIEMLATEAELAEMVAEESTSAADAAAEKKLSKMSIQELQARYLEEVGRPTGSSHRRYLVWKITQARKGKVPVGPRTQRASTNDADMKILPLRMEESLVAQLDEARQRLGLKSRMDLFRRALGAYLANAGEEELAAALAAE